MLFIIRIILNLLLSIDLKQNCKPIIIHGKLEMKRRHTYLTFLKIHFIFHILISKYKFTKTVLDYDSQIRNVASKFLSFLLCKHILDIYSKMWRLYHTPISCVASKLSCFCTFCSMNYNRNAQLKLQQTTLGRYKVYTSRGKHKTVLLVKAKDNRRW